MVEDNINNDFSIIISKVVEPLIQKKIDSYYKDFDTRLIKLEDDCKRVAENINLLIDEILEKMIEKIDSKMNEMEIKINNIQLKTRSKR